MESEYWTVSSFSSMGGSGSTEGLTEGVLTNKELKGLLLKLQITQVQTLKCASFIIFSPNDNLLPDFPHNTFTS